MTAAVATSTHDVAVRFDGVTHRHGAQLALDGLSLEVGRGETVALLGPNGAGKSTTMAVLLGLVHPALGTVQVLGTSPHSAVAEGRVGAMLQTGTGAGLPSGARVEEVLRMICRLYRQPAPLELTVQRAGIGDLMRRRTHQLSGGQVQRVRFAIAIAGDPELVLLDEPTAAMDIESRRTFWRMIRLLGQQGRTIVFATHHLQEADHFASRVVVLNHGKVIADGGGAALKAAVVSRRIRFTCPSSHHSRLEDLQGVTDIDIAGTCVVLSSLDTDATVCALVRDHIEFSHLEVGDSGLEEAFVYLTASADSSESLTAP